MTRAGNALLSTFVWIVILVAPPAGAATITVTLLTDAAATDDGCTLREAMINANADDSSGSAECAAGSGVDRIEFASSGTIALGGALGATDDEALTIDGTGRAIELTTNGAAQLFNVNGVAELRLRGLTLRNSTSNFGGCAQIASGGTLSVERVTFFQCLANYGGAIYSSGSLTAVDSEFVGNTGFVNGGAIVATGGGTTTVDRCTFSGNNGPSDGGAFLVQANTLTLSNSTFSGNLADFTTGNGGAIALVSGTVTIRNSTFSGNQSDLPGSALFVAGGSLTVTDSILANGVDGANCSGTIVDGGGNLTWPEADTSCPGAIGDPMLGPLQANGGLTSTFDLEVGSAALDSANVVSCPEIDQRGVTRPRGEACDLGAVESLGEPGLVFWGDFEFGGVELWSSSVG